MRYYSIELGDGTKYSSIYNGKHDPNALQVELDISTTGADVPSNGCFVRIWGVGLQAISQSRNLFQKSITVRGGMSAGLPLANPAQAGVLATGNITKAFGNWEGVDQTLDLIFSAGAATNGTPGPNPIPGNNHFVLNWEKGQGIAGPLRQALSTAYPGMKINMNIAKNIVAPQDQHSFHANLQQLAYFVRRISQQIIGGDYQGVSIAMQGNQITVGDSGRSGGGVISYTDLVGQPTWIGQQTIQFKTVMRADLHVLDVITMPQTWVNSRAEGNSILPGSNQALSFQGKFQIISVRHVGNSRAPSGDAWCSIFDASTMS